MTSFVQSIRNFWNWIRPLKPICDYCKKRRLKWNKEAEEWFCPDCNEWDDTDAWLF